MRSMIRSLFVTATVLVASSAALAAQQPFAQAAFDQAVAAGQPVVVDFSASWCPTCRAQKPLVESLLQEDKRKPLTLFVADFDKEVALKKQLGVSTQSTFVVFKGGKEIGRSTGQTDKAQIGALFDKAL